VLCVDAKARRTELGHADGINARTVEILATLGLEHVFLKDGREFTGTAVWHRRASGGLERTESRPFFFSPARYGQCYGIHQGRFEQSLSNDLAQYVEHGVQYGSQVLEAMLDENDPEYPVVVKIRAGAGGEVRTVRTKYLVGADGAHSAVRRAFDIEMQGDSTDEIWGVIDFVPDTDFPDIRRMVRFFHENDAHKMDGLLIPREKLSNGDYLCRMYVDMSSGAERDNVVVVGDDRDGIRRKKAEIKKTHILERAAQSVAPYNLGVKAGTNAIWWATYSVGQRLAEKFTVDDSAGHPRVFLIGDGKLSGLSLNVWLRIFSMSQPQPSPRSRSQHQYSGRILPVVEIGLWSKWPVARPHDAFAKL